MFLLGPVSFFRLQVHMVTAKPRTSNFCVLSLCVMTSCTIWPDRKSLSQVAALSPTPIFHSSSSRSLGMPHVYLGDGRNTVSRVLFRRRGLTEPRWVLGQTRWVLRKTRWVRFGPQILGWKELSEFAPRNSVSPKKLTEFGVWNRTPRNRIQPVSEYYPPSPRQAKTYATLVLKSFRTATA